MRRVLFLLCALLSTSLQADETKESVPEPPPAQETITEHKLKLGGKTIQYQAIAGETYLYDAQDKAKASIYSISYLQQYSKSERPVTFIYNGGPGSSSVWLHLGIFGPKRVVLPEDGIDDGAAPYQLIDNQYSLLDISDLVFIDPVGTGFSRPLGDTEGKEFWGIKEDAESISEFIRLWLTKHKRWNSPKYLAGESYGTTRSAALLEALQGGWTDISINGVMLISSILDFSHSRYQPGNHQPYIGTLPTMAATAWYHGKVSTADKALGLEAFVEASRDFALHRYGPFLLLGNRASSSQTDAITKELARFTGLSPRYLQQANLRVSNFRFMKELLRSEGKTVGRLDSRYLGQDYDNAGERFDGDPSGYGIDGAYTAAMHHYLYQDLQVEITRPFKILSGEVNQSWNWETGNGKMHYVNVAPALGRSMRENRQLRVLVANGYYDLATPFFATENTFADNGIDPSKVTMTYYPAGHMMYVQHASLVQLSEDIRRFYQTGQ